jgi:hypothetical protein
VICCLGVNVGLVVEWRVMVQCVRVIDRMVKMRDAR